MSLLGVLGGLFGMGWRAERGEVGCLDWVGLGVLLSACREVGGDTGGEGEVKGEDKGGGGKCNTTGHDTGNGSMNV